MCINTTAPRRRERNPKDERIAIAAGETLLSLVGWCGSEPPPVALDESVGSGFVDVTVPLGNTIGGRLDEEALVDGEIAVELAASELVIEPLLVDDLDGECDELSTEVALEVELNVVVSEELGAALNHICQMCSANPTIDSIHLSPPQRQLIHQMR